MDETEFEAACLAETQFRQLTERGRATRGVALNAIGRVRLINIVSLLVAEIASRYDCREVEEAAYLALDFVVGVYALGHQHQRMATVRAVDFPLPCMN